MAMLTESTDRVDRAALTRRGGRTQRQVLRVKIQELTSLNGAFTGCGRPINGANGVSIGKGPHGSGYGGLKTCGSAWVCAVCAAKVGAHRGSEVASALATMRAEGGSALMLTLTMRHRRGHSLRDCFDAVSAAWKSATNGRIWRRERREAGCVGYARFIEVTHGDHGWHVHIHALVLFEGVVSDSMARYLTGGMFARWSTKLRKLSPDFEPLRDHGGMDWRRCHAGSDRKVADYITKIAAPSVVLELTGDVGKVAHLGSRNVWQLAADAVAGDPESLRLWHEFEQVTRGRRAVGWTRGLRDRVGLGAELTDEQIVDETEAHDEQVAIVSARTWAATRAVPHLRGELLDLADAGSDWRVLRWWARQMIPDAEIGPPEDVHAARVAAQVHANHWETYECLSESQAWQVFRPQYLGC